MLLNKILRTLPTLSFVIVLMIILGFSHHRSVDRMMMTMKSQSLQDGKVVNVEAEMYYNNFPGTLLTRYTNPPGQLMLTNEQGELRIYNEEKNTVTYLQGEQYSMQSNLIHFFLKGKTQDLGLEEFGFQLMHTEFEDHLVITEWFPPQELYGLFNKIKMVHEDFLPIYVAYYDAQRNLAKKVYYAEYKPLGDTFLPTLITEFDYVENDSVINRIRFTDIKLNHQAQSAWFNFTIPSDATVIRP